MTVVATNTPYAVISDAYMEAGLLQEGDTLKGEQIAKGIRRLTDLILFEQTQGLKLWLQTDTAVPLVTGQTTYAFDPGGDVSITRPLRVLQGYYLNTQGTKTPLVVLSRDEYTRLSQVSQVGSINSYFVDKQQLSLNVSFWLTPDQSTAVNGQGHVILQQQLAQFSGLTDTMNFPLEWRIFLVWGLADQICTGQPETIMQRCAQMAEKYRMMLEDWDVEDAPTMFAPDQRLGDHMGQFV